MFSQEGTWQDTDEVSGVSYTCGYCETKVGPTDGYFSTNKVAYSEVKHGKIYICPNCNKPTYVDKYERRYPNNITGNKVKHLSSQIENLYNEARSCISVNAYTSAVLSFRKLLMSIAVDKGAGGNLKFVEYVNFLNDNHYVPPGSKEWVDHIRKKGNEATHEIPDMEEDDALELLDFTENLLRIVYEMPGKMNKHKSNNTQTSST